jgi:hypothetical protein
VNYKKLSLWLRGSLLGLPILLVLLAGSEREASAYTDPGTGALILQMLAAGFVSAIFYVKKFTNWFKPKKKDPTIEQ